MGGISFNPDKDIPDLSGKVFLITGGTGGLGKECIIPLAKHNPAHVYFTGRNAESAATAISEAKAVVPGAKVSFIRADLADLESVQEAAKQFVGQSQRLDVLMCNAGIMAHPPGLTKNGYESQFGTNHVGHALLIKLLLPTLERTAQDAHSDVKIILLSSTGFRMHPPAGIIFKDLQTTQDNFMVMGTWIRYGQSKVANVIYAHELARRYPNITSVSVHPGVVKTALVGDLDFWHKALVYATNIGSMKAPEEGAWHQLWAATADKSAMKNGAFYEPMAILGKESKMSSSPELGEDLWTWTQKQLEPYHL
ncbi:MAG: hypothetical protein M1838_003462 [Thelocarpon superellum]|nr:MAG: hypothetical protein M1838_003462 [Thelocarpon superellum]